MSNLVHVTKCLLCDPKSPFTISELEFEPDGGALNGQVPQRLTEFNLKLLGHIQKGAAWEQKQIQRAVKQHQENGGTAPDLSQARHLVAFNEFLARVALAQGLGILAAFQTSDPGLNSMKEMARFKLHEVTRKFFFTDDMILDAVQKLNLDLPDQDNVVLFSKAMRDALLEQGQYAPKQEQPTGIVI